MAKKSSNTDQKEQVNGNKIKGESDRRHSYYKRKRKDREKENPRRDMSKNSANDIGWYAQSPDLLRDTANFPWSTQNGLTYGLSDSYVDQNAIRVLNSVSQEFTNPGIIALRVVPGIGNIEQQQDAVNIAANAIYTFVRHYNSGSANYDAPDLMMYLLQMDEVFCAINWVQRILGTINMYNVYNRYTPKALLQMQGVDFDDIKSNQVWLRAQLNTLITQAATLVVPNTLPLYLRHKFLFSRYYIEGDDMKDQIYFATPLIFRKLVINPGGGPGSLSRVTMYAGGQQTNDNVIPPSNANQLMTAQDIITFMYDMISNIYMSEDFGIMAGDILKAYGEANVAHLGLINADYICSLDRNDEVLLQFKNATACVTTRNAYLNNYANTAFGDIIQDPNSNLIYEVSDLPKTYWPGRVGMDEENLMLMMTLSGAPSAEMNMIMSRLQSYAKYIKIPGGVDVMRVFSGTEKVAYFEVCCDIDPWTYFVYETVNEVVGSTTMASSSGSRALRLASKLQAFKYAPQANFYVIDDTDSSYPVVQVAKCWQVDNFTIYPAEILDRMNAVAIMSEMNIPHVALIS